MMAYAMTLDPSIPLAVRVLLTLIFAAAVYGKLRHRDAFVGVVANYDLLPQALVPVAAWSVLGVEAGVIVTLLSGIGLHAGAALAAALLCGFAVAMGVNLARGRTQIDCGCFQSALRQPLSIALVVRNLLLAALTLAVFLPESQGISALQWLDGVAAGLVLFVLQQAFGQLLALREAARTTLKRFA